MTTVCIFHGGKLLRKAAMWQGLWFSGLGVAFPFSAGSSLFAQESCCSPFHVGFSRGCCS